MDRIDAILNRFTMYRLVVYVLSAYAALGVAAAWLGRLPVSPTEMVVSLFLVLVSAYAADRGLARYFGVPSNDESWLITGLIIFLIMHPATNVVGGLGLVLAGALGSASKYLIALRGKHIFNPAAFAAAVLTLTGLATTTWWIGSSMFWPVTLVLGLAIVRKIRRGALVVTFAAVAVTLQVAQVLAAHQAIATLQPALFSSPLIFLATIMLTEPATMPPRRTQQMVFAGLVAALYVLAPRVGPLSVDPEVALLLGNVYAYVVSAKSRVRLTLREIQPVSEYVYNYIFAPDHPLRFLPGQYMEWTLAGVPYDSRGNRRTFTIASSPTEPSVQVGLKYYQPASMYKATFARLEPGDIVYGSQPAGNFTMQGLEREKLAFVAGGIGVTPFRSMIKYLADTQARGDIILLYVVSDEHEFAYAQELKAAEAVGVRTIPIVTRAGYQHPAVTTAKLSADLVARLVPDHAERRFFISGPPLLVDATRGYLDDLGIARTRIRTDHFAGY
jgi:ferredoxin-NADP reductase/Na+-translocating ferredoxin:NAD+ oxidoreductase RnfD subunit